MGNELAARQDTIIQSFDDVARIGKAMAQSGYFSDARDAAKAIVKILAGREMGFGPFAAMSGIHIIKGKPTVGSNLMSAAVRRHPSYDYRVAQMDADCVSIAFYQAGEKLGISTFTKQDAQDAGLMRRDNWQKYTRNMLFARAMSNGVKWYCPDVVAGSTVYHPDELSDEGIVEGEIEEMPQAEATPEPAPESQSEAQSDKRQRYLDRWATIAAEADSLGLDVNELSGDASLKEIEQSGITLKERIEAAEGEEKEITEPASAEAIRERVQSRIEQLREDGFEFATGKMRSYRGAMNANLEMCFADDAHSEQKRHFVLEYLTGAASSKDLDDAQIKGIHLWMRATKDETDEWHPDPESAAEARVIAHAAELDAGQQVLEF